MVLSDLHARGDKAVSDVNEMHTILIGKNNCNQEIFTVTEYGACYWKDYFERFGFIKQKPEVDEQMVYANKSGTITVTFIKNREE